MIVYSLEMTTTEVRPLTVRVLDLRSGETVVSAVITHTPPSGSPLTIAGSVSTPNIVFSIGPFAVPGEHFVKVQAVGNATPPSKPETVFVVTVKDY